LRVSVTSTFPSTTRAPYSSYLEHFRSLVKVLEHYGGAIGEDPGLLNATAAVLSDTDDTTKRLKIARDRTLALAFLK